MSFKNKELTLQERLAAALDREADVVVEEEKETHGTYYDAIDCLYKQAKSISVENTTLTKEEVEVERRIYRLAASKLKAEALHQPITKAAAGTATTNFLDVVIGGKLVGMIFTAGDMCQVITPGHFTITSLSNKDLAIQLDGKTIADLIALNFERK